MFQEVGATCVSHEKGIKMEGGPTLSSKEARLAYVLFLLYRLRPEEGRREQHCSVSWPAR